MNYIFYYVEASLMCMLFQGIILYNELRGDGRRDEQIVFVRIVIFQMLYFCADSIWALIDGRYLPKTPVTMGLINCPIYFLTCGCTFNWYIYANLVTGSTRLRSRQSRFRAVIPVVAGCLLVLLVFLTGHGFYINDAGKMVHPWIYYSTLMIPVSYVLIMCIQCLKKALVQEGAAERLQYMSLAIYPVILLFSALLQIMNQRCPVLCFGATFAVFYVYIISLDTLISSDPLTQLNNRNQLSRFLQRMDKEYNPKTGGMLYVMMMDIDHFKNINDIYGHPEGDRALVLTAKALKTVAGNLVDNRPFLARYGGDEFLMAVFAHGTSEAEAICQQIKKVLKETCSQENLVYELEISIGFSMLETENDNMRQCIMRADSALYERKKAKGAKR